MRKKKVIKKHLIKPDLKYNSEVVNRLINKVMKVLIVVDMLKGFCRPGYPLSLPQSTGDIEKYILSPNLKKKIVYKNNETKFKKLSPKL